MTNEEKLLIAFKQRNLDEFKEIIKCEDLDINYTWTASDNRTLMTLLDLACEASEASEYVLILLLNGAVRTYWNRQMLIKAFERNLDTTTINYLVVANILKVEPEEENKFYDTLIRTTVEKNDVNIMKLIAYYRHKNLAPEFAHLSSLLESIETVRLLIEYFDVDMEFQRDSHGHARTYRDIILQKYPQLKSKLPIRSPDELQDILYSYLYHNAPELFLNRIAELSTEFLDSPVYYKTRTYLFEACKKGYIDVVDALIEKHGNVNMPATDNTLDVPNSDQITALAVAAYMGHYKIVTKLISHNAHLQINKTGGSILTFVIYGMNRQGSSKDTHREILNLLLTTYNSQTVPALNINHKDEANKTPLHYAVALKNEFAIKSLLDAGADVYSKDAYGRPPLTSLPLTILEKYFDESIKLHIHDSYRDVEFDYSIFKQNDQNFSTTGNEMEFFHLIQQNPELRTLLKHTLSESFLCVKWCLVRKYYFLNFAFYLSFCVALNAYIFQMHDCPPSPTSYNSSQLNDTGINHHTPSILCDESLLLGLGIITFLFYIVFILRELCQVSLPNKQYFRSPENWLEMTMIVAVGVFFANQRNAHVAVTINLISGVELVFLLGKHPWFSVYIEMFKTVALNFAKFLALFSILAISFANSFYILFRDKTEEYISSENQTNVDPSNQRIANSFNSWPDLKVSLIKSIIMMTGELDASNLPLGENFNYSYVFFSLFVFLVPVVLYNLLNGLAISDTNVIMKDSEIVAVMSRVELIWQLERLLNSKSLQFFRKHFSEFLNLRFFRDVDIIGKLGDEVRQQQKKLIVESFFNYRIKFGTLGKKIGEMPLTIINQAEQIVQNRNNHNSAENVNQNLSTHDEKKTSSNSERVGEAINTFSDQMHDLKLEIDVKIVNIEEKIAEMNEKIADRDKKLLKSVDERNAKLLESVVEAVAHLKPIADRDEKLLQSVDERNAKLLESVVQAVAHLKQKE
ncbi:transient receptor potential cation channel protein painless-like [Planococcus citri]|uniref:transient receptor potential cation channel protein painless-like n=1 Tax=Planococcus citri TaxID=170843 RepID=UPI0031F97C8E